MDRKALIAKKRKDKGFTLIELLIVIAILGILSTINATPKLLSYEAPFGVGYLTLNFEM